jgi:hypothetical protein
MHFRRILVCLVSVTLIFSLGTGLSGCASRKKSKMVKPSATNMADQSGDVAFQSFVSLLRKAVAKRDESALATMMTGNFGYSWEPGGEGPGVFEYWNRTNLWPELQLVLKEKFVPSGKVMVAPAQTTFDPDYKGYVAGLQQVNGSWRFIFFVSAAQVSEAPAQ